MLVHCESVILLASRFQANSVERVRDNGLEKRSSLVAALLHSQEGLDEVMVLRLDSW